jgi:hypothetical protein
MIKAAIILAGIVTVATTCAAAWLVCYGAYWLLWAFVMVTSKG